MMLLLFQCVSLINSVFEHNTLPSINHTSSRYLTSYAEYLALENFRNTSLLLALMFDQFSSCILSIITSVARNLRKSTIVNINESTYLLSCLVHVYHVFIVDCLNMSQHLFLLYIKTNNDLFFVNPLLISNQLYQTDLFSTSQQHLILL